MDEKKFDPQNLHKLNNPQRFADIPPEFILSKLTIDKPDVLVDIGAGTAFFSIAFLRRLNPSAIYACDISDVMVNWVRENVSPKHPGIIAVKSEENSLPLDDQIADLVFMINLYHELENPSIIVKDSFRILKPGGEIFIVDWKKKDMPEGPPVNIRYFPEQVRDRLMSSAFEGVQIYTELPRHFLVVGKKNHKFD